MRRRDPKDPNPRQRDPKHPNLRQRDPKHPNPRWRDPTRWGRRRQTKNSLEEIHLQAMRLLVAELEKRRFAKVTRPRGGAKRELSAAPESDEGRAADVDTLTQSSKTTGAVGQPKVLAAEDESESDTRPVRRTRYIPAAIRRAVFERDEARCTYVDSTGQRCRETHCLELHHLQAFALGGDHEATNLALRCRAHNALAAEEDFGRDFMDAMKPRRQEPPGAT